MEDLNKNQIVLLTLLVSFVTSIATGIMTVSLLQQAPVEVIRNINSIVEKTIERVTPANPSITSQGKEITTIIVKEEDSIVDTISKNVNSIVRIKEKDTVLELSSFYGIGLVVNKDGFIGADRKTITSGNIYTATMNDGTEFKLTPIGVDKNTDFILFKAIQPEKSTTTKAYSFVPAVLSETEPKLGQTLIGLGGDTMNVVSIGRINAIQVKESGTGTSTTKYIASIDTDLTTKDLVSGSPAFNLSGDVIGIRLSSNTSRSFTPTSTIKKEISILMETPKEVPKTP